MKYLMVTIWCALFLGIGNTQEKVLVIDSQVYSQQYIDFLPYTTSCIDTQGIFQPTDILSGGYDALFNAPLPEHRGYQVHSSSTKIAYCWVKLNIRSDLDFPLEWMLHWFTFNIDVYENRVGSWQHYPMGFLTPTSQRLDHKMPHSVPSYPVSLDPHGFKTLYFRIPGNNLDWEFNPSAIVTKKIFDPVYFYQQERSYWRDTYIVLGIFLAVFAYHFLIFLYQRKKEYLYFALFLLSYSVVYWTLGSLLSEWLKLSQLGNYIIIPIAFGWTFMSLFLYLFTIEYLDMRTRLPRLRRGWLFIIVLRILLSLAVTILAIAKGGMSQLSIAEYKVIFISSEFLSYLLIIFPMVAAVIRWWQKQPAARIYFIAMLAFVLQQGNIIQGQVGFVVTTFLFALGIAHRLKSLDDARENAERSAFQQEMELEKVKEVDQFKTRFFTNISHDFRTPLTIILGMVDQIRNQPSWLDKGLSMIKSNGRKLNMLVNQLLEISKLQNSHFPVHHIQSDIIQHLRQLVASFQSLADEKEQLLTFDTTEGEMTVTYDPNIIDQIFNNLIDNAIKYTPQGGDIAINCANIGDGQLSVAIRDNGIGIRPDDIPHIFDRYFQVDKETHSSSKGYGIGLSLTKELLSMIDGNIDVQSQLGEGTTFTVTIPVVHADTQHVTNEDIDYDVNQGQNEQPLLLIVEDNRDVITYLRSILDTHYRLAIAMDGKDGLEKATDLIPNLIVSDVMMPVMDGFTLCKKVKEDYRTSHIPVILLTAKADLPSRIQGLEEGADAYIAKPFSQEELLVRIKKLLEMRHQLFLRYSQGDLSDQPQNPILVRENTFIKKVTAYINDHLQEESFDVPALCAGMAMSKSQLYRKFQALHHMSAASYIRKLRMQKAKHLLMTTTMNVTEVSMEVGIPTLSTFSKIFKEEFGKNPSELAYHLKE